MCVYGYVVHGEKRHMDRKAQMGSGEKLNCWMRCRWMLGKVDWCMACICVAETQFVYVWLRNYVNVWVDAEKGETAMCKLVDRS